MLILISDYYNLHLLVIFQMNQLAYQQLVTYIDPL